MIAHGILPRPSPTRILLACVVSIGFAPPSWADEAIVSMDVELRVSDGGEYEVTETIEVRAENKKILHGIYRDIPTLTRHFAGALVTKHDLLILGVWRDDKQEVYREEPAGGLTSNARRLYIGDASRNVPPGIHTYKIVYRTRNWATLGINDTQDEVSWNVTGQDWDFPIEAATFTLLLPGEIPADQLEVVAWTGPSGARQQDWQLINRGVSRVEARTTSSLDRGEGWTVSTRFPTGVLQESARPSTATRLFDNARSLLAFLGLAVSLLAYGIAWFLVGKDPPSHGLAATPDPPVHVSPVDARYLRRTRYDPQCFAVGLVSAAKAGAISIEPTTGEPGQVFIVRREPDAVDLMFLPNSERLIVDGLLGTRDQMRLGAYDDPSVKETIKALKDDLTNRIAGHWFVRNTRWLFPGLGFGLLGIVPAIFMSDKWPIALFLSFWLTFWTLGVTVLVMLTIAAWKFVLGRESESTISVPLAIVLTLFLIPFACGEVIGLTFFTLAAGPVAAACLAIFAITTAVMFRLMKAPTAAGREILDQIDGYELWLREEFPRRLQQLDASQQLKLVDEHLPWIMALDVSRKASAGIASTLEFGPYGDSSSTDASRHRPTWYHGSDFGHFVRRSGRGLVAAGLAGAVISSDSPKPSSSSGSSFGGGGGGGAGSGGGGGGGGGW